MVWGATGCGLSSLDDFFPKTAEENKVVATDDKDNALKSEIHAGKNED